MLNNFGGEEKHKKLLVTVFQNLFPPIHVQSMRLSQARRVVLLSYNAHSDTIEWRHFLISVRPVGVSRSVRRVIEGTSSKGGNTTTNPTPSSKRAGKALPNLGNVGDISEYVLGRNTRAGSVGATSDTDVSEAESEIEDLNDPSNTVELFQRYVGRGNDANEQRAVRLREVGPRIELKLIKIEDGMAGGETLYHNRIQKSAKEQADLRRTQAEKVKLRKERKAAQDENVKRKKNEKEEQRRKSRREQGLDSEKEDSADDADADNDNTDASEDEFEYEDRFGGDSAAHEDADLFDEEEDFDDDNVSLDEGGSDGEEFEESDDDEDDAQSKKRRS